MAVEELSAPAPVLRPKARITGVTAGLTFAKVAGAATGFITGPLLARALGAGGRGDLAAVAVPLALAPPILGLGISAYAFRTLPRGRRPEEVLASLGLPLILIGLVVAACSVPIADALAGGRSTVRLWLVVVFMSTPLLLVSSLVSSALVALERWRAVFMNILAPFAVTLVGIGTLYAVGALNVGSAAAVTIAAAWLSLVPGLPLLGSLDRLSFRRSTARDGLEFGLKSWAGGLAQLVNLRLDQLLMITAVAPRVLGLYAVATTLSGAPTLLAGALTYPLMTRVASGETDLIPRAVRTTIAVTLTTSVALAALTPIIVGTLFGAGFAGAVPMAVILLAAGVPLCGAVVLSSALQADGRPIIPSVAEGLALIVTGVGLLVLLGPWGGEGAAIVSLAAYSTSFLFQLTMANRHTAQRLREYVVPTRGDVRWVREMLREATGRLGVAGRLAG